MNTTPYIERLDAHIDAYFEDAGVKPSTIRMSKSTYSKICTEDMMASLGRVNVYSKKPSYLKMSVVLDEKLFLGDFEFSS